MILPSDVHLHGLQRCQALCTIGCQPSAMRVPMGMGESTKLLKWFQVLPHFHNFPFLDSRVSNYPTTLHLQIENPRSAHGSPQKKHKARFRTSMPLWSQDVC
jgi:hypothetical protein